MLPKTVFSQTLLITEQQRDAIVTKLLNAKKVTAENAVLIDKIKTKDSVISIQTNVIGVLQADLQLQQKINTNNIEIIALQTQQITNEKKRGRRKSFYWFLKGVAVGAAASVILIN